MDVIYRTSQDDFRIGGFLLFGGAYPTLGGSFPTPGTQAGPLGHSHGGKVSTAVEQWVQEVAATTKPDRIVWCAGSEPEYENLIEDMLQDDNFLRLNPAPYPECYLHRSDPNDVARTEHLTFICTPEKDTAGPTNNWMSPQDAKKKVGALFSGSMAGRTMFVVPYIMGPENSPFSKVGVEITDSPYVVINM